MLERLALCCLLPPPALLGQPVFDPSDCAPRAASVIGGIFCLDPDAELRIQEGGTCAGNTAAQAIETGHRLLGIEIEPVSGTACWAQGQLFVGPEHGHVDPNAGAFLQRVLQAAAVWGWASRKEHPETGLQELDAAALGEIVARANGPTALEHELVSGGFFGDRLEEAETALRDGRTLGTSGYVDEGFAKAGPGSMIFAPTGGAGHALLVDAVQRVDGRRFWGARCTWGRGQGEPTLARRRLWGDDGWMRSRWDIRACRVVRR